MAAGAAAAAPQGVFKHEWMRAPACGSGADVQAAGHTPGSPVAPARSHASNTPCASLTFAARDGEQKNHPREKPQSLANSQHEIGKKYALSLRHSQLLGSPVP
jgi:hypothetical protein